MYHINSLELVDLKFISFTKFASVHKDGIKIGRLHHMGKLIAKMPHADVVSIKLMKQPGVEPTHFYVQMSDNSINVYSLAKLKIVTTIYPPPQAQEILDVFYVGAPLDQIALLTSNNELCLYSYRHQ